MIWMVFLGAIAMIIGGWLIVSPHALLKMSDDLNRMVTRIDEQVVRYRFGVGISLILAAVFLFFYAYMLGRGR
jgi:predicted membrane-bound mannosyltransferase